jgi:radical SAM protein with 4Fe4S-binding SPASM domain
MASIKENKIKKWIKYSARDIDMMDTFPDVMQIEPCSYCNYSCVFCPYEKMTRPKGYMNFDLYKNIINQCSYVEDLGLHHMGEPLLHPEIEKFIYYAEKNKIKTTVSTNASLLNREKSISIIKSGLSRIIISFEANSEEEYLKSRKHSFCDVYENILAFLEEKLKNDNDIPYVTIKMIVRPETEQLVEQFKNDWANIAGIDQILLNDERNWAGAIERHGYYARRKGSVRFPCRYLWESLVVLWDGRVVSCCKDFDASNVIGDLNKQTLIQIWNSENIKSLRELHIHGEFSGFCKNCNEWRGHEEMDENEAVQKYVIYKQYKKTQKNEKIYYKAYDN